MAAGVEPDGPRVGRWWWWVQGAGTAYFKAGELIGQQVGVALGWRCDGVMNRAQAAGGFAVVEERAPGLTSVYRARRQG
jgi:hypothetical protein